MKDIEFEQKQEKAKEYATNPELFKVLTLNLEMRSKHGIRHITYDNGNWSCTCDFFQERGTCSHVMAAGQILGSLSLTQPLGNEQEEMNDSK